MSPMKTTDSVHTSATPTVMRLRLRSATPEERIEVVCTRGNARDVLDAVLDVHPYEEPAYHLYETLDPETL